VTMIGYGFMSDCTNLKNIDLTSLVELTSVGDDFLKNCENLQEIKISRTKEQLFKSKIQNSLHSKIVLV